MQDGKKAQDELAAIVTAPDDKRKRGIAGTIREIRAGGRGAPISARSCCYSLHASVLHYEFTYRRVEMQGAGRLLVFGYQQIDGPEGLTDLDGKQRRGARETMRHRRGSVGPGERLTFPCGSRWPPADRRRADKEEVARRSLGGLRHDALSARSCRCGPSTASCAGAKSWRRTSSATRDFHKFDASSAIKFNTK